MALSRYRRDTLVSLGGDLSHAVHPFTPRFERADDVFYTVRVADTWQRIAWVQFGSPEYWWVVCEAAGVRNPFDEPTPGQVLRLPRRAPTT